MKHYFLIAKDVGDLTAIVCAAMEERQAKPRAVFDRFVGQLRRRSKPRDRRPDFAHRKRPRHRGLDRRVRQGSGQSDPAVLGRRRATSSPIHPDALRLVTQSLQRIDAKLRSDPEANRLFIDILTSRNRRERALRLMNEAGVLGRFIPDFGRIVAMMQFNMYHHYTVDEHLLRAVGESRRRWSRARAPSEHPLASEILPSIANRTRALSSPLFLHDIAKGRKEDHSIAGAAVARKLCPRLGLNEAETETVAWLVENHLVMSNIGAEPRPRRPRARSKPSPSRCRRSSG